MEWEVFTSPEPEMDLDPLLSAGSGTESFRMASDDASPLLASSDSGREMLTLARSGESSGGESAKVLSSLPRSVSSPGGGPRRRRKPPARLHL